MKSRSPLHPALLAGVLLSSPGLAQRFVSLDGGVPIPPELTAIPAPPGVMGPPCGPLPPICALPLLPVFPPGIVPPGVGGEAIDEATATAYATDGVGVFISAAYPGCVVAPPIPLAAWPAGLCGPVAGPPIVAMSDSATPGAIWIVSAIGLVSLIPVAPGPPLAQAFVPAAIPAGTVTGITFDPATGLLWFTSAVLPAVVGAIAPAVGTFACAPLPPGPILAIPACLPPPFIGVTVDTAVAPGPIPALTVSNGLITADITTGLCTCPVLPPAVIPTTDIDFADIPEPYGVGCGCGPPTIGTAGGYPVLGNGGFTITVAGAGPGVAAGALFLSIAPAAIPLPPACTVLILPPVLFLPPVVPVVPGGPPPCPGTAAYLLPVPAGPPALVGALLYFQWALFPAGPPGFELSNGLEVAVGFP
ncbi:MAG TPA: hypothetical protein VKF62_06290 [Planctomycetota bacterium]|nr:hypothetical protein [Planctomycetota bacterium]